MPALTAKLTIIWETLIGAAFTQTGRVTSFRVHTATLTGADKAAEQMLTIPAGISAQQINLAPLGVSAPGTLIVLNADFPVDIRTNAANDTTFLSGVTLLGIAGHISNVYASVGDSDTTISLKVEGGADATLQTSFPV